MANKPNPRYLTGEGKDLDPRTVSKAQLEMGIQIEMEHTNDRTIAKRIALDHLAENPRYYTYLKRMERQMKIDEDKKKQMAARTHTHNAFGNQQGIKTPKNAFKVGQEELHNPAHAEQKNRRK